MTIEAASLRLEALGPRHDRASFNCGNDALDRYIREQAGQDIRRDLARVFVAVQLENPHRIVGYFTLSATSISRSGLPVDLSRKLPAYPVPAALVGRFAIDRAFARSGVGSVLLGRAVRKILAVSETLAIKVVVVDPIDDAVRSFYLRFGFKDFIGDEHRMYLLLSNATGAPSSGK